MSESKFHEYPVPDGFPQMSLPVKPEARLANGNIKITYLEESDLEEWSRLLYTAFPDSWWDLVESEDRPPLDERVKLMAKQFLPWLSQPGFHAIKAVNPDTGELMGIAGWHECGVHHIYPTEYAEMPDLKFPDSFIPSVWRNDVFQALGMDRRMGWTEEETRSVTRHHDPENNAPKWRAFDAARLSEMGDQPHWYLAPTAVWEKWRGRGVGKELLDWGLSRADAANVPTILEAFPNARPVYYHVGFKPTADHGPNKEIQLVRPKRAPEEK